MTKTINLVQKLVALLLMIVGMQFHAYAQSSPDNWTISTQVKKSDCQSDGSIKVINTNDGALFNHSYSLQENTPGGLKKEPQTTPVFNFIPAGTYTVTVTAQLKSDATQKFTRTLNNVVVPGDYKPLDATHNLLLSRSTFAGCPTGTIVLNVTNPKPSMKFEIIKAPAGVATGVITPKDNGDGTYTLPGENYPAGVYEVHVSDQCMTRSVHLNVKEITKLPTAEIEDYRLFSTFFDSEYDKTNPQNKYSCSAPIVNFTYDGETISNQDLMRYLKDGLFEIAMSTIDREPADAQYHTMSDKRKYSYALDFSPNDISDSYSDADNAKTHKIVIRLKTCHDVKREIILRIPRPWFLMNDNPPSPTCGKYTEVYNILRGYSGILCYPVTVKIRENSITNPVIGTEVFNKPEDPLYSKFNYDFDKEYFIEMIDAKGKTVVTKNFIRKNRYEWGTPVLTECEQKYKIPYRVVTWKNCLPYDVEVINTKTNETVQKVTFTTDQPIETPNLELGVTYKYVATKDGMTITDQQTINPPKREYLAYSGEICKRDVGVFRVAMGLKNEKNRTVIVKQGSKELGRNTSPSWDIYFTNIYMPAGTYQVEVLQEGCPPTTVDVVWKGFYNRENFGAELKQTCTGLEVTPTGFATFEKKKLENDTYFRILGGPEGGYAEGAISLKDVEKGTKFILTKEGTYLLGLMLNPSTMCGIDTVKINYSYKNLRLASQHTSAYACGGGSTDGHILSKAEEGVAPYRYELWDENNTTRIMGAGGTPLQPLEILSNGVAHFVHGVAGDTYTVRVIDACNNSFPQKVTITDLTSLTIASSESNVYCAGDPIQLQCLPLHQYKWYRPNAKPGDPPFSTEQNPIIPNARVEDSGLYKVVAEPLFCAKGIEGYVNITVHPCHAPVNPHLMNRVHR